MDNPFAALIPDPEEAFISRVTFQEDPSQDPNAISPKGAKGRMQVMDATNRDPGYGVRPAQDNSEAERTRVGQDYARALLRHYGDQRLAAAAYNAGPSNVDKWLRRVGDPRAGQIGWDDFLTRIPSGETRNYVASVAPEAQPSLLDRAGSFLGSMLVSPAHADTAPPAPDNPFLSLVPPENRAAAAQPTAPIDNPFAALIPKRDMPAVGPLPGKLFLNPDIAPKVPDGAPRPFAPGEYVQNPNGSWSSEISVTVQNPKLNGGKPTIVPSLWVVGGKPTRVSEDRAAQFAVKSGLPFHAYDNLKDAEAAANARESAWQGVSPKDAAKISPLWDAPDTGITGVLEGIPAGLHQMFDSAKTAAHGAPFSIGAPFEWLTEKGQQALGLGAKALGALPVQDTITKGAASTMRQIGGQEPIPESAASQPFGWEDLKHPLTAAEKTGYGLLESAPAILGGNWKGAGAAAAVQALGPYFQAEIQKTPKDPNAAYARAIAKAGTAGIFTAAGWKAFEFAPFAGKVKNVLLQAFGIQPAIFEAQHAAENVQDGKSPIEGAGEQYPSAVLSTLVPMAGHAVVHGLAKAAGAADGKTPAPPPQAATESPVSTPPRAGTKGAEQPPVSATPGFENLFPPKPGYQPLVNPETGAHVGWFNPKTGEGVPLAEQGSSEPPPDGRDVTPDLDALSKQFYAAKERGDKATEEGRRIIAEHRAEEAARAGTPSEPIKVETPEDLTRAGERVDTEPTPGQIGAANYRKGHVNFQGFNVTIETPKDAERHGVNTETGEPWSVTMPAHYGYIKRTVGNDEEHLDAYLGDDPKAKDIFVVDQMHPDTGAFDEHKVMLGFQNRDAAAETYRKAFSDDRGADRIGAITQFTPDEFKEYLKTADRGRPTVETLGGAMYAPFKADDYMPEMENVVRKEDVPLQPTAIAKRLGIYPEQAARVLAAYSAKADGGVRVSKTGLRRTPIYGPADATTALARAGGIRDDEGHDLTGRSLNRFIPGAGPLIRPRGMSIDEAGEFLQQRGYFQELPTEDEVLQLLEMPREQQFGPEEQADRVTAESGRRAQEANDDAREEIEAEAKDLGETFTPDEVDHILSLMGEGYSARSAVETFAERMAIAAADQVEQDTGHERPHDTIPGWDEGQREPGGAGEVPRGGRAAPEGAAADETAGVPGGPAAAEDRGQAEQDLATEPGAVDAQGHALPQTIVPGADHSARQLAAAKEAKGHGKVAAKAPQRDAGGMFGGPEPEPEAGLFEQPAPTTRTKAADEFKVGDVLDPQGKTNMKGRVTITAVEGNTLKFRDEKGTDYSGMARATVRNLINGGSWKRVDAANLEQKSETPKREPTPAITAVESADKPLPRNWKEIGKNADGNTLYEDEKGIRAVQEGHVRRTEPVGLRPTRAGTQYVTDRNAHPEFEVAPEKPKPNYGTKNTVFTSDAAEKARELLRKKMGGQLNVGLDPELVQAGITLAGYHIEAGARSFHDYAKAMIADLGEAVRPYLKSWYNAVRDYPGFEAEGMTPYEKITHEAVQDAGREAAAEAPAPKTREIDDNGNPVFKEGERVVLKEGELAGRHGTVYNATGIKMVPLFGTAPEKSSYHYQVETDGGAITFATKLDPETERPVAVVKDPTFQNRVVTPEELQRSITNYRESAKRAESAADRARIPAKKIAWKSTAQSKRMDAEQGQRILDEWKRANPDAARAIAKAPEPEPVTPPAPPSVKVSMKENRERNGVELKFDGRPDDATLARVKAAGFRWSKPQRLWYAKRSDGTLKFARDLAAAPKPEVPETDDFRSQLDRRGAARFDKSDYKVVETPDGYAIERVRSGDRTTLGGDWDRERALNEAVADATAARETPTQRAETNANIEAAHGEMNAGERQPSSIPQPDIGAGAVPPQELPFAVGDLVNLKPERRQYVGHPVDRRVTDITPDGKTVTLDGGQTVPADWLEPALRNEQQKPTLQGKDHGHGDDELRQPVSSASQRAGSETVHGAAPERETGRPPAGEGRRGADAAEAAAGTGTEGRGGGPEGSAGTVAGGGTGHGPDERLPSAGERAKPGAAKRSAADKVEGKNFTLEPGAVGEERGPTTKARDNLAAIEIVKRLADENRPATIEEQRALARYVGWGGLSGAFERPGTVGVYGKGFEDIGRRLKDLLTPDEYETARKTTQYAHYTAEDVIRGMWDAVKAMGFDGGAVFEPGMGIGHFLGMMPPEIAAKSRYQGIELDPITTKIAKALYPESGIKQADFTQHPLPENVFDLVIGNPPFSDAVIKSDEKYAARNFMLHDYFFAKSIDAVRPGGLLGFVTSAGTMNKIDDAARQYMAERAEFLGGVRLPSTAFKKNAGTEVTTDILFFKKRPEVLSGEELRDALRSQDWLTTVQRELPDADGGKTKGNVNAYFSNHPEQVLGEEGFFDKLYKGRYAVHARAGEDLGPKLAEALGRMPKDVLDPPLTPQQKAELDFNAPEKKDGSFYIQDGKLMQYSGGVGRPVQAHGKGVTGGVSAAQRERIVHLVPVRDALRDVYAADLAAHEGRGAEARKRLNDFYDRFLNKFGPVNKAEYQYRRPDSRQQEYARAEAREAARDRGMVWREGSVDAEALQNEGKSLPEIARIRKDARERLGDKFDEGTFSADELPDITIERKPNLDPFMDDPESYRLSAIENYNSVTGEHSKRRIFVESVLTRETEPDIRSAPDGVLWSYNKFGRFDLDAIAKKMGREANDVVDELGDAVYRDPGHGAYQTADEYLSGDIIDKLAQARAAAADDPAYARNVAALEAAMPPPLAPSEIAMRLGMPWLPQEVVDDFVQNHAKIGKLKIKQNSLIGGWTVEGASNGEGAPNWAIEIAHMDAKATLKAALNQLPPRIYKDVRDELGNKHRVFDAEATQAAQDKVKALQEEFLNWSADPERSDRLADIYNAKMNRTVPRRFDGSYLTTPGIASDWSWRPHQRRAVARVVQVGTTYLAHAVGAGKTSEMIGAGMEMRRLGLVSKPMFAVPNHMLGQFTREFYMQYPTARIMVADDRRFHTSRRKQFIADAAQSDVDGIIITHSALNLIPTSHETQRGLIQEELKKINDALMDLDRQEDRFTVKKLENQKEKLEQRMRGGFAKRKDQTNTFEEMGVDFLFVDEAQKFRKLDFATKRKTKGIDGNGSDRAWDLYAKVRHLDDKNPGRSVVFASGTPITNTMGELYTISRYLQRQTLEKLGLSHFDSWASAFGEPHVDIEQTATGDYEPVERFKRFVNAPELYKIVSEVMDVVTPSQLSEFVVRPKLKGGERKLNMAPRTEFLDEFQQGLRQRVEDIKQRKGPPQKGDDIILSVISDGRLGAIDPRFINEKYGPNIYGGSKLSMMVDNVFDIWKRTHNVDFFDPATNYTKKVGSGPATQMVFSNLGVNPTGERDFTTYNWIKRELVRRGIPPAEIAFIRDFKKSPVATQKLFNDVNEGKVRVIIGSTEQMGTGTNAQRRLIALHNLDPLWFPADDEQRVGRILRQGNLNPEIEVHDYTTKGTYDATMWKLMANKGKFVEQFFRGDPELRHIEDLGEASMYDQVSAMSTADERVIKLTDMRDQLERAERRASAHDREQYTVRRNISAHQDGIRWSNDAIAGLKKDLEKRDAYKGAPYQIGGKDFDKPGEAAKAIDAQITEALGGVNGQRRSAGSVRGFELTLQKAGTEAMPSLERADGSDIPIRGGSGQGILMSAGSVLDGIPDRIARQERSIAHSEDEIAKMRPRLGIPFQGGDEIKRLREGVQEIEGQLEAETKARAAAAKPPGDQAGKEQKRAQVAYHGSPHDFDEFRNEAIGTGEGAQAFGYGHYFAGKKEIAEYYRDGLSTGRRIPGAYDGTSGFRVHGQDVPRGQAGHMALDTANDIDGLLQYTKMIGTPHEYQSTRGMIDHYRKNIEARIERFRQFDTGGGAADNHMRALADFYDANIRKGLKPEDITESPKGRLYQVDLAPKEEEYLDWDKPIGKQSEHVKKALKSAGLYKDTADRPRWDEELDGRIAYKDFNGSDAGFTLGYIRPNRKIGGYDVHHPHGPNGWGGKDHGYSGYAPTLDAAKKWIERAVPETAWQSGQGALPASYFYRQLAMQHGRIVPLGRDGARWDVNSPDPRAASEALHAAGIPGIRYLDNVSRGQGEGSRNYVIFDPQHIKIEKKAQIGPFYSALTRAVENAKTERAPASQWESTIKNLPSIKDEEVQWSGVREWLADQKGPVAKSDLLNFLRENEVRVEEVERGGNVPEAKVAAIHDWVEKHHPDLDYTDVINDAMRGHAKEIGMLEELGVPGKLLQPIYDAVKGGATKFGQYALPGGQNYRELLLTLPEKASGFDPSKVEIKRHLRSTTQGGTSIWYDGKKIIEYDDSPTLGSDGKYHQRPDSHWMDVARSLYERGDRINKIPQQSESFRSSHWEEPNVLAHVRFDDRTGPNGEKILHVAEIQSDFGQKLRRVRQAMTNAIDADFQGIVERMKKDGVLVEDCD